MKQIPLTKGKFALVDVEDFDYLSQWKWHATKGNSGYYAVRAERAGKGKQRTVSMARTIMKVTDWHINVDHINGDTLDNQKHNLRACSRQQNTCNRKSATGSSSKFIGVSLFRESGRWKAQIQKHGKRIYLGLYDTEESAALAYDRAASELHGEFARLNFIHK